MVAAARHAALDGFVALLPLLDAAGDLLEDGLLAVGTELKEGYRDYSAGSQTRFGANARFLAGPRTLIRAVGGTMLPPLNSPRLRKRLRPNHATRRRAPG